MTQRSALGQKFGKAARGVRAWLGLRSVLVGLGAGASVGGVLSAIAWWQRFGPERLWVGAFGALAGVVAGAVQARQRRWTDTEVALFLDARLGTRETVTTALELDGNAEEKTPPATEVVLTKAMAALDAASGPEVRPSPWSRWQLLIPVGVAAITALSVIPLPKLPPKPVQALGADRVQLEKLKGLEKIEALSDLGGTTPDQRERLKQIAEAAKKLQAELQKGMEKREALSRIAKLRDDIAAEKMKLGDAQNRAGLDAAVEALGRERGLQKAAEALGDGDLVAFDEEMQKLANLAEKSDRETAKHALEEAEKAARSKGAKNLADALERERKKLDEAEGKAEALRELGRELGQGLDAEGREALEDFGKTGSPEAQRKLVESMERALKRLTEDERKRLAENLKKRADQGGGRMAPMSRAELEELARRLSEKDADKLLEEQLRELAKQKRSEDAERERGLGEADRGGSEAQRGLGAMPIPMDGKSGPGQSGKPGDSGKQDLAGQDGSGGPGSHHDEGTGDHDGETKSPGSKELRSKAQAQVLPGAPMHGATLGRAPARPGETANQLGAGSLGVARPAEIGAVEGTDIPEEYREQVGRYFEP